MKKNSLKKILNVTIPFLLGGGILYWMYRDFDFSILSQTFANDMKWGWLLFSLLFGISAQIFRALRWHQ